MNWGAVELLWHHPLGMREVRNFVDVTTMDLSRKEFFTRMDRMFLIFSSGEKHLNIFKRKLIIKAPSP
jgi:hypothetical protein